MFNDWSDSIGGYNQDDGYFVSSFIYDLTGFFLIQFDMWDMTGSVLSSLAVPTQTQFQQLSSNGRVLIRRFEDGVETGLALGSFGSVTAHDVPEPGTFALTLAALLSVGAMRRRRASVA